MSFYTLLACMYGKRAPHRGVAYETKRRSAPSHAGRYMYLHQTASILRITSLTS